MLRVERPTTTGRSMPVSGSWDSSPSRLSYAKPSTPESCKARSADTGTRRGGPWLSYAPAPGGPAYGPKRDPGSLQAAAGQPIRDTHEQLAPCRKPGAAEGCALGDGAVRSRAGTRPAKPLRERPGSPPTARPGTHSSSGGLTLLQCRRLVRLLHYEALGNKDKVCPQLRSREWGAGCARPGEGAWGELRPPLRDFPHSPLPGNRTHPTDEGTS